MTDKKQGVVIIGGGIMGGDIAIIFATGNWNVHVMSPSEKTRASLPARIKTGLQKLGAPDSAAALVKAYADLESIPWQQVDLVVEAATEDLALKQKLFSRLETLARPDIPLASNTSTFPIGDIGRHLKTRSRVVGLHYFMPAHLVPLVEIIQADFTDPKVADALEAQQKALGKAPVRVNKDIPGFIGNRLQHAMKREAIALVAAGHCDAEGLDEVVKHGFGARLGVLGPLEQSDLNGLTLTLEIHETLIPDLDRTPGPDPYLVAKVRDGELGAATGRGFREWADGEADELRGRVTDFLLRRRSEQAARAEMETR
jgi:3-hydroxybutyryl-CoA dehydrogenase